MSSVAQRTIEKVQSSERRVRGQGRRQVDRDLRALLRRCRHALAVGAPEWERDVETAMEMDAALVAEIDAAIGTT